jgi:hypothetical protein
VLCSAQWCCSNCDPRYLVPLELSWVVWLLQVCATHMPGSGRCGVQRRVIYAAGVYLTPSGAPCRQPALQYSYPARTAVVG